MMLSKPRVLIFISFSFSIRYIVRTGFLKHIQSFCEPIVLITWNQKDLVEELTQLEIEVHVLKDLHQSLSYRDVRKKIDFWFKATQLKSPTEHIGKAYLDSFLPFKKRLLKLARERYNLFKLKLPSFKQQLFNLEKELLLSNTDYALAKRFISNLQATAVFTVTPFHAREDIWLRAAKDLGLKMITSILSFDNVTKRGWLPVSYDTYMVWNSYNAAEIKRIYPLQTQNAHVEIIGAPQFDFYYNSSNIVDYTTWKEWCGLPQQVNRKIILYGGGPESLFPHEYQYVLHLDAAIETGEIEGKPIILLRAHPSDNIDHWKTHLQKCKHVVFDKSWGGTDNPLMANVSEHDVQKLCSTLYYTDVHVNVASTLTVDGSAYNKPQIGPAYDDVAPGRSKLLRDMYFQEHFLPIMKVKGLALAESRAQLIEYTNKALVHPQLYTQQSRETLKQIIQFDDGNALERLVHSFQKSIA